MNVCMLMYRVMPQDHRRFVVANSIAKKNDAVDIYCIKDNNQNSNEICDGQRYHRLPIKYNKSDCFIIQIIKYILYTILSFFYLMKDSLLYKKYDVIHVHNPPDFIILAAIPIKLLFKTKIILDLHDMLPESVSSNLNLAENHLLIKFAKFIERFAVYFSDSIICTNKYDKEIVLSRNNIYPDKIFIVMNSPDLNLFLVKNANKSQFELEYKYVILFEGTIWKRRGIQTVIDALELLKDKIPIYFLIIGDGPDKEYLDNIVKERNISDYVKLTGWVGLELLSQYISISDVCIIPFLKTKVNERGVPNKLFEYILHEKPVITSNLKGIASTFNKDQVIFFEPGDAEDLANKVLWCYNNPEKIREIVMNANNRYFAEYTWNKMENALYQSYDYAHQSRRIN